MNVIKSFNQISKRVKKMTLKHCFLVKKKIMYYFPTISKWQKRPLKFNFISAKLSQLFPDLVLGHPKFLNNYLI
jgi:hypothetical protein